MNVLCLITTPLPLFSSEIHDSTLGLQYYNYRHLNLLDGRWVNRDPIWERGGVNIYGVCNNAINNAYDFLGLWVAKIGRRYIGFRGAQVGVYFSLQWNVTTKDCKTKKTETAQMGPIFFKHVDRKGDGNYFNPWNLDKMQNEAIGYKNVNLDATIGNFECSEGSLVIKMEYSTEEAVWEKPQTPIDIGLPSDEAWHDKMDHEMMKKDGEPATGKLNLKKGGTATLTFKWFCDDTKKKDEVSAVYTDGESKEEKKMTIGNPRPWREDM